MLEKWASEKGMDKESESGREVGKKWYWNPS